MKSRKVSKNFSFWTPCFLFSSIDICAKFSSMEVILADVLGYCMGVRRAVNAAKKATEDGIGKKVYSLGPLIHNKSVLDLLEKNGLEILDEDDIDSVLEGSVVIVRAHGVSPDVLSRLQKRKCDVVDATCPRVKASQKSVKKYSYEGYDVILAGDRNHGEVLGIAGFAEGPFSLVENEHDICGDENSDSEKKVVFLSQTTFSPVEFEKISSSLQKKYRNLKVMNTICPATKIRQESLLGLCKKVDAVVVIGGKNSANTRRLLETAKKHCVNAVLVENASEIPEEYRNFKKVGVTAGASTPDSDIEEVCDRLKQFSQ